MKLAYPLSEAGELLIFAALIVVVVVIALRIGMLLAPRLDNLTAHEELTTPDEEDDGGRPD